MADLWFPWCSSGDEDCCGGVSGHGSCFACGDCYEVPTGGAGGPLQWLAKIGTVGGVCFGASCAAAGGDHYLDYLAACTWESPAFTLCTIASCFRWRLAILGFPGCDPNPAAAFTMILSLANTCSASEIARWGNSAGDLTCNDAIVLVPFSTLGVCGWPSTGSMPNIEVEPIWT